MAEKEEKPNAELKVSRARRRLYDALPEPPEVAPSAFPAEPDLPPTLEPAMESSPAAPLPDHLAKEMLVKRFARMTMGTVLIPVPLVDLAAGAAVQLKMIKALAELYGIEFSEQRTKAMIGSLIGGLHIGLFTGSILKFVPLIGLAGGVVSSALLSYAVTYALGIIFVRHFDGGGTFLNFDVRKASREFPQAYAQGREKAAALSADLNS